LILSFTEIWTISIIKGNRQYAHAWDYYIINISPAWAVVFI